MIIQICYKKKKIQYGSNGINLMLKFIVSWNDFFLRKGFFGKKLHLEPILSPYYFHIFYYKKKLQVNGSKVWNPNKRTPIISILIAIYVIYNIIMRDNRFRLAFYSHKANKLSHANSLRSTQCGQQLYLFCMKAIHHETPFVL